MTKEQELLLSAMYGSSAPMMGQASPISAPMMGQDSPISDPNTAVPLIYRGVPAPPKITGIPAVDALLSMAAPAIGQTMLGMTDPRMVPSLGPGVSPSEAIYMRDINQPLVQMYQDRQLYKHGGRFGEQTSKILTNIGMHDMLGVSSERFQREITNIGVSPVGRQIVGQLMTNRIMQDIMGGDVIGATDQLLGARHKFGMIPGQLIDPYDIPGQTAMMQHGSDVADQLMKSVYTQEDGTEGITPNYNYTRGFKVDDLARMGTYMAERGVRQMKGIDINPREKSEAIGEMARVMESLADLTGLAEDDLTGLSSALERITGKQWPKIFSQGGAEGLARSFGEMNAMAQALNVTGEVMYDTVAKMQTTMDASLGISAEAEQLGVNSGGYRIGGGNLMANRVLAIAATNPDKSRQQIMAEQGALLAIGMQSEKGRAAQLVNYLDQQGMVTSTMMEEWESAIDAGDTPRIESVALATYRQAFGSEIMGRELMADDAFMKQVISDSDREHGEAATAQILSMMSSELGERTVDQLMAHTRKGAQAYADEMGVSISPTPNQVAIQDYKSITGYLNSRGDEKIGPMPLDPTPQELDAGAMTGPGLAERLTGLYEDAIEEDKTPKEAMAVVRGALAGPQFDKVRKGLHRSMYRGRTGQLRDIVKSGDYDEIGYTNALLKSLDNTKAMPRAEWQEMYDRMSEARDEARETGDTKPYTAVALAIEDELNKDKDIDQRKLRLAREEAVERQDRGQEAVETTVTTMQAAHRRLVGQAVGVGAKAVTGEQDALAKIYEKVNFGEMKIGDALKQVATFASLEGEDYEEVVKLIKSGRGITPANILEQRAVALVDDVAMKAVLPKYLGETGVGLDGAVEDINNSQKTYEQAAVMAPLNAAMEYDITDQNQKYRSTFNQVALGVLSGDDPLSRMIGVEEAELPDAPVISLFHMDGIGSEGRRQRREAAAKWQVRAQAIKDRKTAEKEARRVDNIGRTPEEIERRDELHDSVPAYWLRKYAKEGREIKADTKASAHELLTLAGSDEIRDAKMMTAVRLSVPQIVDSTVDKKQRREDLSALEAKLRKKGVPEERVSEIHTASVTHMENVERMQKVNKRIGAIMDSEKLQERLKRAASDDDMRDWRVARRARHVDRIIEAEGTGKVQAHFLQEIDFEDRSGSWPFEVRTPNKAALRAMKTLSGRDDSWLAPGYFWGEDDEEAKAEARKIGAMSEKEIQAIMDEAGPRSEALLYLADEHKKQQADVYKKQQAEDGRDKTGAPARGEGKANTMRLTGELLLRDTRQGNRTVGTVSFSEDSKGYPGG